MFIRKTLLGRFWFGVSQFDRAKDYYRILGVSNKATQAEIKKAFYTLAKKSHPDANKGSESKFKEYNQAFNVLSKPDLKKEYDQATAPSASTSSQSPGSGYSGYSSSYPGSSTYSGGFSGYNRQNPNANSQSSSSSYRSQSARPNQSYYQNAYDRRKMYHQDDEDNNLWKNKQSQADFINEMFRSQQKMREQQRRTGQRSDGSDFRSYVNSRTKKDDPPGTGKYGKWESNDPEYVKNYMNDFVRRMEGDMEFQKKVQQQEARMRQQEYQQALKRRQQFEKTVGDVLQKGQEFMQNPKQKLAEVGKKAEEKISEVGKKAWDWFTKKK